MTSRGVVYCPCGRVLAVQLSSSDIEVRHHRRAVRFTGQGTATITCDDCRRTVTVRLEGRPERVV